MNSAEHKFAGPAMHDHIIGALETCCRQGEMLRVQNRDVDWAQHQIVIRGANAKDAENRVNVLACEPWVTVEEIGLRGTFAEFSEDQLNWDPCPPYYWLTEHDAWVHFDAVCECHSKPFGHAGRDSSIFTGSGYTQGDSGSREK